MLDIVYLEEKFLDLIKIRLQLTLDINQLDKTNWILWSYIQFNVLRVFVSWYLTDYLS